MPNLDIVVERLTAYSPEEAEQLGVMRNALSSDRSSDQLAQEDVREFAEREDIALIVAKLRETGRIIGCETVVRVPILEVEKGQPKAFAWLGFVATHPEFRGHGIVKKVTLDGLYWCIDQGIEDVKFTSNPANPEREVARGFYEDYGARIVAKGVEPEDTDFFNWKVSEGLKALATPE
jgi:ribosomal protein S18 acetylase RimI-like enzyme